MSFLNNSSLHFSLKSPWSPPKMPLLLFFPLIFCYTTPSLPKTTFSLCPPTWTPERGEGSEELSDSTILLPCSHHFSSKTTIWKASSLPWLHSFMGRRRKTPFSCSKVSWPKCPLFSLKSGFVDKILVLWLLHLDLGVFWSYGYLNILICRLESLVMMHENLGILGCPWIVVDFL